VVTGVSTGSLIATFAFLGPCWDHQLEEFYTTTETSDVMQTRRLLALPFSDSLADTAPLRRRLEQHVTDSLLAEVAKEYAAGRRLLVGTVNLDLGVFTPWDLTEIAASDAPDKRRLYIDVLMASAAIPVQFPPVLIGSFMHADGGTRRNIFVEEIVAQVKRQRAAVTALRQNAVEPGVFYLLVNGEMVPGWQCVDDRIIPIARRGVELLLNEALLGNLMRAYLRAQEDNWGFRLWAVPNGTCTGVGSGALFDPTFMRCLFDAGRADALRAERWYCDPFAERRCEDNVK
jgi:predicted acylesterase/phospholipase RssA